MRTAGTLDIQQHVTPHQKTAITEAQTKTRPGFLENKNRENDFLQASEADMAHFERMVLETRPMLLGILRLVSRMVLETSRKFHKRINKRCELFSDCFVSFFGISHKNHSIFFETGVWNRIKID